MYMYLAPSVCTVCSFTDRETVSGTSEGGDEHISSPIRVSPDRRESKRSPRHAQGKDYSRLPAKERLFVSKNAIGNCLFLCASHVNISVKGARKWTWLSNCMHGSWTIHIFPRTCVNWVGEGKICLAKLATFSVGTNRNLSEPIRLQQTCSTEAIR